MASSPTPGRRSLRPTRKSSTIPANKQKSRLSQEMEELRQRELEIKKQQEEMQRKVTELPKKIEERQRKQRELIQRRAVMTPTAADVFNKPRDKRHVALRVSTTRHRMTRPEERSAKIQIFFLCAILAFFVFLLFKSLPH